MPGVTVVGDSAFWDCPSLRTVDIPSIATIEQYGFIRCVSLSSLTMAHAVDGGSGKSIDVGFRAFNMCESLVTLKLPEGVVSLGREAFSSCKRLSSVAIPASVTAVGRGEATQTRAQPATRAVTAVIRTVDGSGYRPPGA